MKISDSDTSCDTSSDSDTSESESEVEESDTPPSRSSIISPKLRNRYKTSTYSSSSCEEESDYAEDDIEVG